MTNTNTLPTATIEEVVARIHEELVKRGFHVTLLSERKNYRDGSEYIEITSEAFNTTPVIFKEIRITANIGYKFESGKFTVGGRVGVRYDHFGGGSNGCELFHFSCVTLTDLDGLYQVQVG